MENHATGQRSSQRVKVPMLAHMETTLDHPVETVWPYLLHWETWIERNGGSVITTDIFGEISPPDVTEDMVQDTANDYRSNAEEKWQRKYYPELKRVLAEIASS